MTSFDLHVPPTATGGVVAIGNFDGVHRGHQEMLAVVKNAARAASAPAVIVTFDPHPVTVLNPQVNLPRLSTICTRTALLTRYGADEVVVLPVTTQLLHMTPQQFFDDVVVGRLKAVSMVEGPDFRFGKDRTGDTELLKQMCAAAGMRLQVISAVRTEDQLISSTVIRGLIAAGDVRAAVDLLGHEYTMTGVVAHGAGRGRTLGFPTANLENTEVLLPADGVYAGAIQLEDKRHPVAVSIGPNPTFGDDCRKVECHVIDFSGDLYGKTVSIDLIADVRKLTPFDSVEQLTAQIEKDIARCRQIFDRS